MGLRIRYLLVFMFVLLTSNIQIIRAADLPDTVTAKSMWNPNIEIMKEISDNCGRLEINTAGTCLTDIMKKYGASAQAIGFTQLLGTEAYMNGFKELGKIDAAFIFYPLRSSDREGCVLVNGNPDILYLDDLGLLPVQKMEQNTDYIELEKKYPHLSIYFGDLRGTVYPYSQKMPNKVTRIVTAYSLRNGCGSCQLLGFAEFGFDFDSTGKYAGCSFLSIKKVNNENRQTVFNENPANYFSDPEKPVNVTVGEKFALTLVSNHSQGFKWQLADKLDSNMVALEGTDFIRPYETLPNAPGKELWFFKAKKKGVTKIKLEYIPSWDDGTKSFKTYSFTIYVE